MSIREVSGLRGRSRLGRVVAALTGGAALTAGVALAVVNSGPPASAAARTPASRVVELITGERVTLTTAADGHVTAALGTPTKHFISMGTPTAQYVIPDEARPYLGRQLDLSLFNVTAPPTGIQVTWAAGATPHAIPGLSADSGRIGSGTTFGAALRSGSALAGVAAIRAASPVAVAPSQTPQFNLATVIVRGLDRTGAAVSGGTVSLVNVDDAQRFVSLSSFFDGSVAFSVPVGRYTVSADVTTPGIPGSDSLVIMPDVDVAGPLATLTVDARTATSPVPVPRTTLPSQAEQMSTTLARVSASGALVTLTDGFIGSLPNLYITPLSGVATGVLHWSSYFRLNATSGSTVDGQPYLYDVEFPYDNQIPAAQPDQVDPATLARLDAQYHSDVADEPIATYRPAFLPWQNFALRPVSAATAPLRRVEYVTARSDLAWVDAVIWRGDEFNGTDQSARTVYRAGQEAPDVYLTAPLVPGAATGVAAPQACTACRQGDTIGVDIPPWSDGAHAVSGLTPSGTLKVTSDTQLSRDGQSLWHTDLPTGTVTLPADPGQYQLVVVTDKTASWTTTATHTSTTWTWHSQTRTGTLPAVRTCPDGGQSCAFEPLLFLGYDLGADLSNAIPAGAPVTVQLRAYHQMFDTAPDATGLTLDASTDDGATWTAQTVRRTGAGTFSATLPGTPAGFLSLRVHASDPQGDAIDQTVIHAVKVG